MWELYYKESWALKNWCFWTVVLKTFESSLDCKEIQPVILKEITSECWLEGLMLKLKLQYFGHLMRRADSLEKTLMLGKTEGGRRRGQQRMKWLDGITDSTDMSLGRTELNWTKETFSQAGSVGNFGISEGSITEKKKKITTEFALKNYQSKSGWHACIHPQQVGTGCGGAAALSVVRVRTGVECHEDILREIKWHRNPNHRNARETKKNKEPFP